MLEETWKKVDTDGDLFISADDVSKAEGDATKMIADGKEKSCDEMIKTTLDNILDFYNVNNDENITLDNIEKVEEKWADQFGYKLTKEDTDWIEKEIGDGKVVSPKDLASDIQAKVCKK